MKFFKNGFSDFKILCLFVGFSVWVSQAGDFTYQVRLAIFSDQQFFWPGLTALQKTHPSSENASKLSLQENDSVSKVFSAKLGVLPLEIKSYQESIPCDSCHRLSANGMEFYLENYLKDKLSNRFPKSQVDLVAPHFELLKKGKLDLMAILDSLTLPWSQWFPDSNENLIYRPRDRMLSSDIRKCLDQLGGRLNQDYLLLPTHVDIAITPLFSNTHTGGFSWTFGLVFWNVRQGRVEWALLYNGKARMMDLDQSLDAHLDKALGAAWDGLPAALNRLLSQEPH